MIHVLLDSGGGLTITEVWKLIQSGGLMGLLVFILAGGYRGWWVFGWQYKESEDRVTKAEAERDDWRDIALHGTNITEKAVDLFRRSRDK